MALELKTSPSLKERTTLRLGGTAEVEALVRDKHDLDELANFLTTHTLRPFVIGEGSNILAQDGKIDLALIRVDTPPGPDRVEQQGDKLIVRCGAAQRLPGLLGWAQMAGLSGLEGLTGIPGSVGGAVAMNAGSYGVEFADVVKRIHLWSPMNGLFWVTREECQFGYREFSPGRHVGKCLVWEVELALTEANPMKVRRKMQDVYNKKKATQPVTARSAGCVFKNPEDQGAGLLLDKAGMKGKRIGDMAYSDIHANFLVNLGEGAANDAIELLEMGRSAVKEQFDITLETEVIVL